MVHNCQSTFLDALTCDLAGFSLPMTSCRLGIQVKKSSLSSIKTDVSEEVQILPSVARSTSRNRTSTRHANAMMLTGVTYGRSLRPWVSRAPNARLSIPLRTRAIHNGLLRRVASPFVRAAPASALPGRLNGRAWESTVTGDKQTGHIAASDHESIIFVDSKQALSYGSS